MPNLRPDEIDLSDAVVVEIAARDETAHERVRDVLDEFQAAAPAPRLAVEDWAEPVGPGWPFTHRVRVRHEDGLDLLQMVSDAVPGTAFNIGH